MADGGSVDRVEAAQEPVAHGEQCGGRASGDPDLGIDVLHVVARGLRRDAESMRAILRLDAPRDSKASTSTSRSVNPAGPGGGRVRRCPAEDNTASTALASRRPLPVSSCIWRTASVLDSAARCGRGSSIAW